MNEQINPAVLADLSTVAVNKTFPVDDKRMDFVRQTDPYNYMVCGVMITALFDPNTTTLENRIKRLKA